MAENRIPDTVHSIHLMAACGTGMGALAAMLTDMGFSVTGSDQNVYPPMSTFLEEKGIRLFSGFSADNLNHRPDLVIVGNAVTRDNPEAVALMASDAAYCSMPQAINRFIAAGKQRLVVTGTHGKTTTASLLAWVLESAGTAPTFLIGGILKNFDTNARIGSGPQIVLEGDEYDTAFFDKGPKFLHYRPDIAVLTGVEFDHADIFRDLDHVRSAFTALYDGLDARCAVIACDGDAGVTEVLSGTRAAVFRYGRRPEADWHLGRVSVDPPWIRFDVQRGGRAYGAFRTRMPGMHNLLNSLAVIAVADRIGISPAESARALETFEGIRRRQEVRGARRGVTVVDDFAHHPTAVRETISAMRPFYPDGRLIAVFEPRTHSSMRSVFQTAYAGAFHGADLVCVRQPPLLHKVPQGERFSSQQLVADLRRRGQAAHFFPDTDGILAFLTSEARAGDLVLIMSNGGFDNIHERLLEAL